MRRLGPTGQRRIAANTFGFSQGCLSVAPADSPQICCLACQNLLVHLFNSRSSLLLRTVDLARLVDGSHGHDDSLPDHFPLIPHTFLCENPLTHFGTKWPPSCA